MKNLKILIAIALLAFPGLMLSQLSNSEIAGLVKMYDEENLAFNVYDHFSNIYNLQIFENIKASETYHKELVSQFMIKNDLVPITPKTDLLYVSEEIMALDAELRKKGVKSLEDALKSGAYIEELDIMDLQKQLEIANDEKLIALYEQLLQGSKNHLKAFNRQLSNRGIAYQPVFLADNEYQDILNAPKQCCDKGKKRKCKKAKKGKCCNS